jgi:HK97 family phage major capsid protein
MTIEKTPEQIAAAQAEIAAAEQRGIDVATAKVTELVTIGRQYAKHGGEELATRAIQEGKDSRWLQNEIMGRMASGPSLAAPDIGLTDKETRQYSVTRAMGAMVAASKGERDAWKGAEFERECHDAVVKRNGDSQNGGIYVPFEVQKRDMSTAANGGGYLVATNNDASNFIDLLRNRSAIGQMGATFLPGLTGNVTIPKQTGSATGYWLTSETTEITESNQTIGQLALSPKTVGAYTEFSRQLMMQSAPAIDMLIMDDLAKVIALALDLAALTGNGSGAPVGIANTSGIGSVTGTSIDYAKALEFQTDVATANALTTGCGYLTTPAKAAILAQRQKFSSTDTPLWTGNILEGNVCGFNARTTTQISDGMFFGDFAQLIIASWGVLELAVDPTANFKAGIVGIRAFQSADVGVRQAGAFSYASAIS